jgi:hypothetical protein
VTGLRIFAIAPPRRTGTCFSVFFGFNYPLSDGVQGTLRQRARSLLPLDSGQEWSAQGGWELMQDGIHLGDQELGFHEKQEAGQGCTQGNERFVWVAGAGVDGLEGNANKIGQVVGVVDEVFSELSEVEGGERVGVGTGLDGVEVVLGCSARAETQLVVAVGTA